MPGSICYELNFIGSLGILGPVASALRPCNACGMGSSQRRGVQWAERGFGILDPTAACAHDLSIVPPSSARQGNTAPNSTGGKLPLLGLWLFCLVDAGLVAVTSAAMRPGWTLDRPNESSTIDSRHFTEPCGYQLQPRPPPPVVQATVNDQKLTEPPPRFAWTSALLGQGEGRVAPPTEPFRRVFGGSIEGATHMSPCRPPLRLIAVVLARGCLETNVCPFNNMRQKRRAAKMNGCALVAGSGVSTGRPETHPHTSERTPTSMRAQKVAHARQQSSKFIVNSLSTCCSLPHAHLELVPVLDHEIHKSHDRAIFPLLYIVPRAVIQNLPFIRSKDDCVRPIPVHRRRAARTRHHKYHLSKGFNGNPTYMAWGNQVFGPQDDMLSLHLPALGLAPVASATMHVC